MNHPSQKINYFLFGMFLLLFIPMITSLTPEVRVSSEILPTPHQELSSFQVSDQAILSPNKQIQLTFDLIGSNPVYNVTYNGKLLIKPSYLGFIFLNQSSMIGNFSLAQISSSIYDETWEPIWGAKRIIRNHYSELYVELVEFTELHRELHLIFRVFDDGIAFRYFFPEQTNLTYFEITSEETQFSFTEDCTTWWIPADFNSYEYLYQTTSLNFASDAGVNTPVTLKTADGSYVSIHEANLTDWAGMTLGKPASGDEFTFKAELVPWFGSSVKVKASAPHYSPWRTIQIAQSAAELTQSTLILNLNDPCVISDTSWIKSMKYMGIWWGMHRGIYTWEEGPSHGATTDRAKTYIDVCVDLGCKGLLVEGWNVGWDNWAYQQFTAPTSDYDIVEVVNYAESKGISIIGHIETGGNVENYEVQSIDGVFEYLSDLGIEAVKTGYAGVFPEGYCHTDVGNQHHHGQWMVNHYRRVLESAANHHIILDVHEPIKPTGISRTYPNMMTREGVRGQEYNAWGDPPNPPEHLTIIPFTRCLAGPLDYTPGVFDLETISNRFSTLAHQLALYVVLFSPVQMVCDLQESYYTAGALKKGTEFIRNVPVSWDESFTLNGEIGDYVTIARRNGDTWYLGSLTDENKRTLTISLDFLDETTEYTAFIYKDGVTAHFESNPEELLVDSMSVKSSSSLELVLQSGGGFAAEIIPTELLSSSTSKSTSGLTIFSILPLLMCVGAFCFKRKK